MEINWEQLWIDARKNSVLAKYRKDVGVDLWDRGAAEYSDTIKRDGFEYGEQMVHVLKEIIKPDFKVLDIGCGPGTLVIPLAKLVDRVVALDPSKGMLNVLEESAVEAGLSNIETVNKTWQEVDDSEIRESFDLVITSNVLWQFDDIGKQLRRVHDVSRRYCCVILHAGLTDDLDREMWSRIMDTEYNFGIDYIYIYNILYTMGIYANVNVIDSAYTFEKSVNDAIDYYEYLFDLYTEITPRIKKMIKDYIVKNAVDGIYCRESTTKSSVMWWEK